MPRRGLTALLPAVVALSLAAGASPAAAAARCGHVDVPARQARAKVRVVRGTESCPTGRRLIRRAFTAEVKRHWDGYDNTYGIYWDVQEWRCYVGLAETQTFCHRGGTEVDGSVRHDDGWTF
jgi:hypothetical protein